MRLGLTSLINSVKIILISRRARPRDAVVYPNFNVTYWQHWTKLPHVFALLMTMKLLPTEVTFYGIILNMNSWFQAASVASFITCPELQDCYSHCHTAMQMKRGCFPELTTTKQNLEIASAWTVHCHPYWHFSSTDLLISLAINICQVLKFARKQEQ